MEGTRAAVSAKRRRAVIVVGGFAALTAAGLAFTLARPSTAGGPARLDVVQAAVEVRSSDAPNFAPVSSDTALAAGSIVRTDNTGLAELGYADGSLSRIGPDSTYEIMALQVEGGRRQIVGNLEVGRTFHRVAKVSGSGSRFEVHTAGAVAAVRGTAFSVVCLVRHTCEIEVTEGVVAVQGADGTETELRAGSRVVVTNGAPGGLLPTECSPWIVENAGTDTCTVLEVPRSGPPSSAITNLEQTSPPPTSAQEDDLGSDDRRVDTEPRQAVRASGTTTTLAERRQPLEEPTEVVGESVTSGTTTTVAPTTSTTVAPTTSTTVAPTTSTTVAPTSSTTAPTTSTTAPSGPSSGTTTTVPPTTTTTVPPTTTTTTVPPTTTTTVPPTTTTTTTTVPPTTTTTKPDPVCPPASPNAGNPPPCGVSEDKPKDDDD